VISRQQFFEFCDLPWIKGTIREGFMDCLNNIHRFLQPYRNIAPVVSAWAERLLADEILDIGSGGGEQVATILKYVREESRDLPRVILSDLYPNLMAYRALQTQFGAERIGFISNPVAISNIPRDQRILTIFSAFHHLKPSDARDLLADVVAHRDGLCIVEFTRRTYLDLISMIPAFFMNMLAPLTAKHFLPQKLLWGTLIPVVPLLVTFDGMVSVLRSYSIDEIKAMLPPGAEDQFVIESGEVSWGRLPFCKSAYFLLSRDDRLKPR